MKTRYALAAIVLLGLVVRVPFWVEALRTPVDGDTAIIGLMARHPLASTTMWGQPYGSPVEAWLAGPVMLALGFTPAALRLVYFLLGLALIPAGAWLAGGLDRRAELPTALLLACPSPYFLLLSALPPPLYPTALLLTALLLGATLRIATTLEAGAVASPRTAAAWGVLAGLAIWTHLMTCAVVAAAGMYLLLRSRARAFWMHAAVGLLVGAGPLWARALLDPSALRIVSLSGKTEGTLEHLRAVVPELYRPVLGLLGTHVPWIADDTEFVVYAPTRIAFAIVALHGILLVRVLARGGWRGAPGLLLGTVVLSILAFPLPVRSSPGSIRFLAAAYVPIVVLVCWAVIIPGRPRRAFIVVLALASLNLTVGVRLLQAWRAADRAEAPFLLPDLRPVRRELEARGIRRAYASYGPAYRLTFETGERILVSQPWNERFLHHPLPYLDEVRFAQTAAWILTPRVPSDLPGPAAFEEQLGAAGGRWARLDLGAATVFHDFVPPFGPEAAPVESAGRAGDTRLETSIGPEDLAGGSITWTLSPPRTLAGLSLMAGLSGPRLPRGMDVLVSADGQTFERVVRRRRREERRDLRWVNGHPQYVVDDDLVSAALGPRAVAAIRLTPAEDDPWAVAELRVHDAAATSAWGEWLDPDLDWPERRRTLDERPRPDRVDWCYRRLLVERHR